MVANQANRNQVGARDKETHYLHIYSKLDRRFSLDCLINNLGPIWKEIFTNVVVVWWKYAWMKKSMEICVMLFKH